MLTKCIIVEEEMADVKYVDLKEKPMQSVIRRYMKAGGLTQEMFANGLNEKLINMNVSRASVSYWLNGKYEPETDLLFELLRVYGDWRRQFAIDALGAKFPEIFKSGIMRIELPKAE